MRPGLSAAAPAEIVEAAAAPETRSAEVAEASLVPAAELAPWVAAVFGTELGWDEEPVSP